MQTNLSNQTAEGNSQDFLVGDVVVYKSSLMTNELRTVVYVSEERILIADEDGRLADGTNIRPATPLELQIKKRVLDDLAKYPANALIAKGEVS
ncbi:hypothetical protein ACS125_15310 [Acinetobacter sp. PFS20]|uniref:hypothetical protein n=1 Tax=Acinetobacter sp. PFS20 TaxID=3458434 RepID=UPI003FD4CF91